VVKVVSILTITVEGNTFAGVKFYIVPPPSSELSDNIYGLNIFQLIEGQYKYRISYGKLNDIFYGFIHTVDKDWLKLIDPTDETHKSFAKKFYQGTYFNAHRYSQFVREWKQDRSLSDYFNELFLNTGWKW
jgi:hypothetical protein